jgi:hypothetical protein
VRSQNNNNNNKREKKRKGKGGDYNYSIRPRFQMGDLANRPPSVQGDLSTVYKSRSPLSSQFLQSPPPTRPTHPQPGDHLHLATLSSVLSLSNTMAQPTSNNPSSAGSDRPERSRNAKAQARHRAKRKAYIEQVSSFPLTQPSTHSTHFVHANILA